MNDVVFEESERWIHRFELRDVAEPELRFTEHQLMIIIELPKFRLTLDELQTALDAWMYFLQHGGELDADNLPAALNTPAIRKAVEELTRMSHDDVEKHRYEQRERGLREWATLKTVSRQEGREEGREEGRAIGLLEGREEGIDIGELIGTIRLSQRILNRSVTPSSDLKQRSAEELQDLANALQREVLNRP